MVGAVSVLAVGQGCAGPYGIGTFVGVRAKYRCSWLCRHWSCGGRICRCPSSWSWWCRSFRCSNSRRCPLGTVEAVCAGVGAVAIGSVSVVAVGQGDVGAVGVETVVGVQAVGVVATAWYPKLELSVSALELLGSDRLVL